MDHASKQATKQTPLGAHVAFFSKDGSFSATTVTEGLDRCNGTSTGLKGAAIAAFNATHAGGCPFGATKLPGDESDWSQFLHLGTTRIWNAAGELDYARWQRFVLAAKTQHGLEQVVTLNSLLKYLKTSIASDPQEQHTARHASNGFFASVQATAASQAWGEAYNRLACGWLWNEKLQDHEPYMTVEILKLFFEDPAEAFRKAERKELPVAKPAASANHARVSSICSGMTR